MRDNFFTSENIPSFAPAQAYNFDSPADAALYQELTTISQEIERCRASI